MITEPAENKVSTSLRFASALSRNSDTEAAIRDLVDAVREQIGSVPFHVAFVFFSAHHAEQAQMIATMIRDSLGVKVCIGCSGEGVISGAEELETAPAVTLWVASLPNIRVTPLRLAFSESQDQLQMAGWPAPHCEPSTFILLADPISTPMHDVLSVLADRYPNGRTVGGLAGGSHGPGANCLVLDGDVVEGGLVGVQLSGPLLVRTIVSQGCRPIGERYVVTRAERNLVYELGGRPAIEQLQSALESLVEPQRQHAHRALHAGIAIDEHRSRFEQGDFLIRNLIGADRQIGAIAIGDVVQEGQTLQFQLRDAKSASEDLHVLLAADRIAHRSKPLGALVFSCCGRGEGLFGQRHHDSSVLQERIGPLPVAGFFAQGEIGPVGGKNFLHGYTASVAIFSDPD
ncbi:FIST signal transduction protein [Petrachloros mirabilis]